MRSKRLGMIKIGGKFRQAIITESRDGTAEWAREPDSNLVYLPGAYKEEGMQELGSSLTDAIAAIELGDRLTDKGYANLQREIMGEGAFL